MRRRKRKPNPKKVAKHLPEYMQDVAFTKFKGPHHKAWRQLGNFGHSAGKVIFHRERKA